MTDPEDAIHVLGWTGPDDENPRLRAMRKHYAEQWLRVQRSFEPRPPTWEDFDRKVDEALIKSKADPTAASSLLLVWSEQSSSVGQLVQWFTTESLIQYMQERLSQAAKSAKKRR